MEIVVKKPKMLLFDYGETLIHEESFSAVRGNAALLEYASENKYGSTAEDAARRAAEITCELGKIGGFDPLLRAHFEIEVPSSGCRNDSCSLYGSADSRKTV